MISTDCSSFEGPAVHGEMATWLRHSLENRVNQTSLKNIMKIVIKRVGSAGTAFSIFVSAAQAQTLTLPSTSGIQPNTTQLIADLNSIYDTNSAQASPALAAQEHLARAEAIFTPEATLDLSRQFGNETLFILATGGYDFHLRNYELDRERINIASGATFSVSACQIDPTLGYARQQEQLQDTARPYIGNTVAVQSYQINFHCNRTTGFSPTLTGSRLTDNSASEGINNFRVYTANGGVAYDQPVLGRVVGFGEYQKVTFTSRVQQVGTSPEFEGYALTSGGVSFTRMTGGRIGLQGQISYTDVENNIPGEMGYSGPTYQGTVLYTPSSRISLDAQFEKAIQPSNYPGVTFVKDSHEVLEATYTFVSRGTARIGVSTEARDYEGFDFQSPIFLIHERRNTLSAGASWRFSRLLTLDLDTRYEKRIAQPALYTWSGLRTNLALSATF